MCESFSIPVDRIFADPTDCINQTSSILLGYVFFSIDLHLSVGVLKFQNRKRGRGRGRGGRVVKHTVLIYVLHADVGQPNWRSFSQFHFDDN